MAAQAPASVGDASHDSKAMAAQAPIPDTKTRVEYSIGPDDSASVVESPLMKCPLPKESPELQRFLRLRKAAGLPVDDIYEAALAASMVWLIGDSELQLAQVVYERLSAITGHNIWPKDIPARSVGCGHYNEFGGLSDAKVYAEVLEGAGIVVLYVPFVERALMMLCTKAQLKEVCLLEETQSIPKDKHGHSSVLYIVKLK
jgi:hypothetical protein